MQYLPPCHFMTAYIVYSLYLILYAVFLSRSVQLEHKNFFVYSCLNHSLCQEFKGVNIYVRHCIQIQSICRQREQDGGGSSPASPSGCQYSRLRGSSWQSCSNHSFISYNHLRLLTCHSNWKRTSAEFHQSSRNMNVCGTAGNPTHTHSEHFLLCMLVQD